MMADARSEALIKNFVGQWLFLRNVERISPDTATFTNFDENLRASMAKETELCRRKPGAGGPQRRRSAEDGLHLPQSAHGRALRASRASTATNSAA